MDIVKLRDILSKRINLNPEDPAVIDYWKQEAAILSENIDDTIYFFRNDCSDEEFYWLSEVFDDIAEKTLSEELLNLWKERLSHLTNAELKNNILTDIEYAEKIINSSKQS